MFRFLSQRLYLRIWLTVVSVVAILALLAGWLWRMDMARERAERPGREIVVRNAQGVITTASAPAVAATSADGPGLVVVTLVIAARTELFSVRAIGSGDDLRQALESASNRSANDLIAIEIIWMPAEADESLSSIAVETRYPHPDLVKLQGALVGKVFCQYCSGPYPAELVSCPHCGGRAA